MFNVTEAIICFMWVVETPQHYLVFLPETHKLSNKSGVTSKF